MSKDKTCILPGCTSEQADVGRTATQKKMCAWHLDLKYPHVADEAGIDVVTDAERRMSKLTQQEYAKGDYEPCKDGRLLRHRR